MKQHYIFLSFISMIGLLLLGCGNIEKERQVLKMGKELENLRIKVCVNGCANNANQCLTLVEEGITNQRPKAELKNELEKCRIERTKCINDCIVMAE